ncbi:MAG TPA: metalloregulator ArsR/SmtB family transcription factor [Proteobacteria bacterium]|nr:putative HTH-type transcriptional regulator/MT0088 [bacterium BMS3Abin14]HDL52443.1 metalloregulator ArsR/SmtB family transcription factor [Pseudomonadota bacterium]
MISKRKFKSSIYEQLARIGKAVASPKRLELLDLLCQSDRTVEYLSSETGMTLANTSRHLHVLSAARLIEGEKEGQYVRYRLTDEAVCKFYLNMRLLAERRLAEIRQITNQFLEDRGALEAVDRESLLKRVRAGEVTVLDVRPVEEYRTGHIPGAISFPLKELAERLSELPKGQEIAAYCRGPYCVLAVEAVKMLRTNGFHAVRLEDGVLDWCAHGLSVERSREY